jgi:AcrR family transcriptional regulator
MQVIYKKSFTVRQAVLSFLSMATMLAANRIAERKLRDKQARRAQIISAARRIAELEGWSNVTVRRLADEISYSQPVLYAHFGSREGILDAVAIEGFQELGLPWRRHGNGLSVEIRSNRSRPHIWKNQAISA